MTGLFYLPILIIIAMVERIKQAIVDLTKLDPVEELTNKKYSLTLGKGEGKTFGVILERDGFRDGDDWVFYEAGKDGSEVRLNLEDMRYSAHVDLLLDIIEFMKDQPKAFATWLFIQNPQENRPNQLTINN